MQNQDFSITLAHVAIAAGVVLVLVLVVSTLVYLRFRRLKRAGRAEQFGGLSVSEKVLEDQRLSASFVLSAIENGVVMVRNDRVIHLFNPAASKITGWPAEEAVGLDVQSVMTLTNQDGQPIPADFNPFIKALNTKSGVKDSNLWLNTRSGKKIPISLVVSPILETGDESVNSVVGVFADTIKEKEEEAKRSDFISTASHEMRTPIAAIEGYLALALNEKVSKVDPSAKKYLEKASASTKHLGALFADLLTSSKAEDGHLANYPVVVEAGEIVEQVAEAARFNAKSKGLNLRYIVSGDQEKSKGQVMRPLYYTYVDPNRLREVLQNIIDNAIKYTNEGSVTIRLTGDTSVIQIQVADSGPGIPAEDVPHLFQKFYRVDNSMTRTTSGTGLGLFISRRIIEMNNGRIWAESTLGKGSTFFINLPRLTAQKALDIQKRQASQITPLSPNQTPLP